MPFSRESSWLRDQTIVSCLLHWQAGSLPPGPPGKSPLGISNSSNQVNLWRPCPKYHLGVLLQKCFPDTLRHRTLWPSIFSNGSRLPEKLGLVKPVQDKIVQLLSSLTLCVPMDCSLPGFSVLHHLSELAQTHVHCVDDSIQPSHPLFPSSLALHLSQYQRLFQWVGSSHQMAQVLKLQLQHQSFQWIFSVDFL